MFFGGFGGDPEGAENMGKALSEMRVFARHNVLIDPPFSLAFTAANPAGVAHTPAIAVPVIAVLTGAQLHSQALLLDASAPLGFTMTARRTLLVGP